MAALHWTPRERLVLLAAWLGWTFDIMDAALFNLAKVPAVTELLGGKAAYKSDGPRVESLLLMTLMVGWSCGGFLFGIVADRWGRVRTMAVTILLYSLFTGLTALVHSLPQLFALRFLAGLGIGGEWAAGAALVAESVSEDKRARAASWLQSAAAFGPWFATLASLALATAGWRPLFLVGAVPALLTVFLRAGIREPEAAATPEAVPAEPAPTLQPFWKMAVVGGVLGLAGIAAAANVTYWVANIVTQMSVGLEPAVVARRIATATAVQHIGTLIGVFVVPWLCTKYGRRATILACFVLGPPSALTVALFAKDYSSLLFMLPITTLFAIGLSAAFVLYFPEIFPKRLRATGAGISYNGARVLAAGFPVMTAALMTQMGVAGSIAMTSLVLTLGAGALLFSPETKGVPLAR